MVKYPFSKATDTTLTMLLPRSASFLFVLIAASTICCTRLTLEAKVEIITFRFALRKASSTCLPTSFSEGVIQGVQHLCFLILKPVRLHCRFSPFYEDLDIGR